MEMNVLHRKERLVLTSIEIIEELGIQRLTTREIAKRENVSEATIFRHFKNKNELILAILDYYIKFDSDIVQSARLNEKKPLDAIYYIVSAFAEYYENYPAITSITQICDVLRYEPELNKKIKDIQKDRTAVIEELFREAQETEEIAPDLDAGMIAVMISGFFREICFNWRLDGYTYSLKNRIMNSLDLFMKSIQKKTIE